VATLQNGVYRVRVVGDTATKWVLERSRLARDSGQFDGMIVTTGPEGSANPSIVFVYSGGATPVIGTDAITYATSLASPGYVDTAIATAIDNLYAGPGEVTIDHTAGGTFTAGQGLPSVIFVTSDNAGTIGGTTTIDSIAGDTIGGWELVVTFIVASTTVAHGTSFTATSALALPTSATAGQSFRYLWDSSVSKWKRIS